MRGMLKIYKTTTEWKVIKTSKVVMQNQTPILLHTVTKSNFKKILEVSNKHNFKLDKILRNF